MARKFDGGKGTLSEKTNAILKRDDLTAAEKKRLLGELARMHRSGGRSPFDGREIKTGWVGNRVVRPGEIGVKVAFGRVDNSPRAGVQWDIPVISEIVILSTRFQFFDGTVQFPSRSGLPVSFRLKLSFYLNPMAAPEVLGKGFEETIGALRIGVEDELRIIMASMDEIEIIQSDFTMVVRLRLEQIFANYGFILDNIAAPEIQLPPAVQKMLEEIRALALTQLLAEAKVRALQAMESIVKKQAELDALATRITGRADADVLAMKAEALEPFLRSFARDVTEILRNRG